MHKLLTHTSILNTLACAYHHASTPLSRVAQAAKLQPHTVRRNIEKLKDASIITPHAFVDVYRLGYTQFELSYAIAASSTRGASNFLNTLIASRQVAWVGEYSGEFQYVATICCKTPHELALFLATTTSHPHVTITNRSVAVRVRYTEFPLRILSERVRHDHPISFGTTGTEEIDEINHTILSLLSNDASLSTRHIAQQIGLSQTATQYRIQDLERRGIIAGYTYVVDFSKLGLQAFCIVITTRSHTEELTRRLLAFCKRTPEALYLSESVGAYDYKIGILLREPARINTIAQMLTESTSDEISSISTLTAFNYRKVARYPL